MGTNAKTALINISLQLDLKICIASQKSFNESHPIKEKLAFLLLPLNIGQHKYVKRRDFLTILAIKKHRKPTMLNRILDKSAKMFIEPKLSKNQK
jgi:hypothetical protein